MEAAIQVDSLQFGETKIINAHFPPPPQRKRLFSLLSDGFPRSTAEISTELNLCDPRGLIRDLRKSGIPVSDFWVNGAYGRRFKRYFIRKEAGNGNK